MKAKFKVGDTLSVNNKYLREGKAYFGKNLKYKNFVGKVKKVHENTYGEKDGFGDVWQNFYEFENGETICETFLNQLY